jgi:N-acetylglucosaminyldiphosphoundecaprenol N-acetyl-beta-D-mannosaminyltransferase
MLDTKTILGVKISDANESDILEYLLLNIKKPNFKCKIFTPNPEILVYAHEHQEFKKILNHADINLNDGVGLLYAGMILGKPLKQRITGVDFVKSLCNAVAEKPITVGFLGGRGNVAELTAKRLKGMYPSLKIVFSSGDNPDHTSVLKLSENNKKIDILFVAYGFPKQEEWISNHINEIPVKIGISVGGSFDYYSGTIKRAPFFIRFFGFEWLFRLIKEPWRIKRQLALLKFIVLVLKERFAH